MPEESVRTKAVKRRRATVNAICAVLGLLAIPLVGLLHVAGNLGPGFAVFYLLPIAATSWCGNRAAGIASAVIASVSSAVAQRFIDVQGEATSILLWNGAAEFAVFAAVAYLTSSLRAARTRLAQLESHDPLTGMSNLRGFVAAAKLEVERAQRYGRTLTIAYMDLDDLGKFNDENGHEEGDRLIKAIADELQSTMRSSDIVARVGGDEFAVLLPETPGTVAEEVVSRFRNSVRERSKKAGSKVTASIGSATFMVPPEDVEDMIHKAEELMQSAKAAGKDTVRHTTFEGNKLAKSSEIDADERARNRPPTKSEIDQAREGLKRLLETEQPGADKE